MKTHHALASMCLRAYTEHTGTAAKDLEFLIHRVDGITYIAIRGTEAGNALSGYNWLDVVRDIRVMPRYSKATGFGHGGFVSGAKAVAKSLIQYAELRGKIVLTGHSLGAAVAVLVSQILQEKGYAIREVVLFGCPKTYLFRRPKFDYRVTSYRHGSDIVPRIPKLYRQPVKLTPLKPNKKNSNWGDHSIALYASAL